MFVIPRASRVLRRLVPLGLAGSLLIIVSASGGATSLSYTIRVDAESGTVELSYVLDDYPYDEVSMGYTKTPIDPARYFEEFVTSTVVTTSDDRPLAPEVVTPGVERFTGVDGVLRGGYTLDVAALNREVGTGTHLPLVTDSRCVLPLGGLLALPVEVETRGLALDEFAVTFDFPEGWPILTPWSTYDGRVTWREDWVTPVSTGIVCGGEFSLRNELRSTRARLGLSSGLDEATESAIAALLSEVSAGYRGVFASSGTNVEVFIVEESDDVDIRNYGGTLRIQAPIDLLRYAPGDELTDRTREYLLTLTHEAGHRWLGSGGMLRPTGGEVFWVTEGAMDYLAALVLSRQSLTPIDYPLWFLSRSINRVRAMPNVSDPIDRDATHYANHPEYRALVRAKGPLAAFVIDCELRAAETNVSFSGLMRGIFYSTFLRSEIQGMTFGPADIAGEMSRILGIRGKLLFAATLSGDIVPDVRENVDRAGFEWHEDDDGVVTLSWAKGVDGLFSRTTE
jgi:hypothetical protein